MVKNFLKKKDMTNKPVICYLFTKYDEEKSLLDFKENYLNFDSGLNHDLIICYKLISKKKIDYLNNKLDKIKFDIFLDPYDKNDFDFGTYKRFSKKYIDRDILFLNSHSYPVSDNWLKKLMKFKNETTLIGTSASNESLYSSIKLKKKYQFFSYLLKKYKFKKDFSSFPNPHLRTSSFLIKGKYLLDYIKDKDIYSKEDAWKIESGKNSLSNFFKNKNYDVYLVNSDGDKFIEENWKLSETYNYLKYSKSIISDKHTRKFEALNEDNKLISRKRVWGI